MDNLGTVLLEACNSVGKRCQEKEDEPRQGEQKQRAIASAIARIVEGMNQSDGQRVAGGGQEKHQRDQAGEPERGERFENQAGSERREKRNLDIKGSFAARLSE